MFLQQVVMLPAPLPPCPPPPPPHTNTIPQGLCCGMAETVAPPTFVDHTYTAIPNSSSGMKLGKRLLGTFRHLNAGPGLKGNHCKLT